MVQVTVKWNKNTYENVEVDTNETGALFKAQLFALTGVPPENQKVMGFKGGMLKDDVNMSALDVKEGQKIMLMGTAPENTVQFTQAIPQQSFVEDLPEDLQNAAMENLPAGLKNLGNTCYMNATLQCFRVVKELKNELMTYQGTINDSDIENNITLGLRDLFANLETSRQPFVPLLFLTVFRTAFPQFAQQGQNGAFSQQDAEECWNQLLLPLAQKLKRGEGNNKNLVDLLFGGESRVTMKCIENESEAPTEKIETFRKLECNIAQETNSLYLGIQTALKGQVEKHSETLGRTAIYEKTSQLNALPAYLTVQFVRFFWKAKEQARVKVLKNVNYPTILDVYDFCSEPLKQKLKANRDQVVKLRQERKSANINDQDIANDNLYSNPTGWYELCAVLTHKGRTAESGHYVAWTKQDDGQWLKFDDDQVSSVSEEEIKKLSGGGDWHMAYMVLYRARKPDGYLVNP